MNISSINFGTSKVQRGVSSAGKAAENKQVQSSPQGSSYRKLSLEQLQSLANISFGSSLAKLNEKDIAWLRGRLTPEQYKRAKTLFYIPQKENEQFSKEDILIIAKLDDKKFAKAQKLLQMPEIAKRVSGYDLSSLVDLNFLDMKTAIGLMHISQRGKNQFSAADAMMITQLDRADYKRAQKFFYVPERGQRQFGAFDICYDLSKLDDKQVEKAKRLYYSPQRGDKQFTGSEIAAIASLKDKQYRLAQDFFHIAQRGNKQFDGYEICKLANMKEDSLNLARHLVYNPKYQMPKDSVCRDMMNFALEEGLIKRDKLEEPLNAFEIAAIVSRFQQQTEG